MCKNVRFVKKMNGKYDIMTLCYGHIHIFDRCRGRDKLKSRKVYQIKEGKENLSCIERTSIEKV